VKESNHLTLLRLKLIAGLGFGEAVNRYMRMEGSKFSGGRKQDVMVQALLQSTS